jgi:hypothetical protein
MTRRKTGATEEAGVAPGILEVITQGHPITVVDTTIQAQGRPRDHQEEEKVVEWKQDTEPSPTLAQELRLLELEGPINDFMQT